MSRIVVITGGSRGIGAAAVRRFSREGDRVWFLYEKNAEAAAALADETGATALQANVADEASVQAAFAAIPPVDVLINNAGVAHYGLLDMMTTEQWDRVMDVNVGGVFQCVRAALPGMLHEHRGVILNVASMWGQVGASCEVAYSASKGAVIAMTKALAKELGPSNIRVNAVAPGVIATDMVANLSEDDLAALAEETPLGRLGAPEDVANALWFLASDEANFLTGQIVPVNGGFVI
jgi:3-oxoacyl-[acyl-carrier protein] reductase